MTGETTTSAYPMRWRMIAALRRRAEFGDAVALVFVAAFVRQYFWIIPQTPVAWVLTAVVSFVVWYFYVMTREPHGARTPRIFWLIVVGPLLFVYAMRVAYPDVSFDVLNYRLLHAERAMRGTLFVAGDFFPSPAPYNPAPDIVTGISRALLGYRLGTIVNLLTMLWAGQIIEKLLRPYVVRDGWRAAAVWLVLWAEHMLFEINNYMADLLALPLLLEATRLAIGDDSEIRSERARMIRIALLVGASVSFKLTNVAMAIPVILVYAFFALRRGLEERRLPVSLLLSLAAFAAPLVPFSVYIYEQTGSPVFPVFNGVFRSPYWPPNSGWDGRWGPFGAVETLCWPMLVTLRPERLSELAVYSGRISLGFVVALIGLLAGARRDARLGAFSFITLTGSLLWSATTGYIRYALFLELTAGVVVVALVARLVRQPYGRARLLELAAAALVSVSLAAQAACACVLVFGYEWSMRWTVFTNPRAFLSESKNLLRDHSLRKYLSAEEREMFSGVDVWVESAMKTSGIEVMLNRRAPMIGVRSHEYFVNPESRARFARALAATSGKKMYTLCFAEDYKAALAALKSRGLSARATRPVKIPYYSSHNQINMFFIEVVPATPGQVISD